MTIHDGKKRPLNSGPAPRARNRTVVLTPDLAGRVRASVQGGAQSGTPNRGLGGAGEDDGFVRPFQGKSEGSRQPVAESSKPNSPAPAIELLHVNEESYGSSDRHSAAQSSPVSSSHEAGVDSGVRPNNPGAVGAAQVRAAVRASQAPLSARPVQSPQQSSERPNMNGAPNLGAVGASVKPPLQAGVPGRESMPVRPDSSSGMGQAGGSTSARGVPRSTNYCGGNAEVPMVPTSMLLGFMVSFDENPFGEAFEIREGRTIVSSDLPMSGGTVLLIEDASVGSMHAVLKAESDGTLTLLDQLSETGTFLRSQGGEEQQLSGDRAIVKHGDMVRFGSRSFKVILLD